MSTLKVDAIRHNSATSDSLVLSNDGSVAIGTCTAKLTSIGGGGLSNRNIIINGAMTVAQRGTSSTGDNYKTVDRFAQWENTVDEACTQAQADVSSGTTPYTLGFRKSYKITNGNQTSGAQAGSRIFTSYTVEAQDIANSGWNYTNPNSFITLSFWVKSSVAGNFYGYLYSFDGTNQAYSFETGSLSANTWTKVTKKIPGNSNLQFDNNVNQGMYIVIGVYWGTNFTDAGNTMNQWAAWNGSSRMPVNATNWYTTNDATFEYTGVQLEVGDTATSFEHRKFGEELALCERYYEVCEGGLTIYGTSGTYHGVQVNFSNKKRATPTITRISDTLASNVNTPFAEYPSTRCFRATAQSTAAFCIYQTVYSASSEI
jgi:hypothetical protein